MHPPNCTLCAYVWVKHNGSSPTSLEHAVCFEGSSSFDTKWRQHTMQGKVLMHRKNKRGGDSTYRTVKLQSWQAKYQSMNTPGTLKSASCALNRNNGPWELRLGASYTVHRLVLYDQLFRLKWCAQRLHTKCRVAKSNARKQPRLAGDPSKQKQGNADTCTCGDLLYSVHCAQRTPALITGVNQYKKQ